MVAAAAVVEMFHRMFSAVAVPIHHSKATTCLYPSMKKKKLLSLLLESELEVDVDVVVDEAAVSAEYQVSVRHYMLKIHHRHCSLFVTPYVVEEEDCSRK